MKAQGGGKINLHLVFRGRWTIARGPSHNPFRGRAMWDRACQALRLIGRLPGCRLYWANACTRPATAWLTLSVSNCAVDAVNSPAGYLPCWADVDAATATARSRARMAPRRCP
eukprot:scaffold4200_cov124-Isochrysis_galbana.AAC.2